MPGSKSMSDGEKKILTTHNYGGLVLIGAALLLFYSQTLQGLWKLWISDPDYSYALVIPFVSAYIIWEKRITLAATSVRPSWPGGIFVFLFLTVSVYGILGSSPSVVRCSLPLMILAVTLFCYGWQRFMVLLYPLSLLLFMIPLPTVLQTKIGVPLKYLSTKLGEIMLRAVGVSVYVEGNIIDLGVTQLQVVDACSGLRYILPLLGLGVIFVYFFEKTRWKQILLVIITIPISILANGLRISITGFLVQHYGLKTAEGFFHGFSGWLIFVFAIVVLISVYMLLRLPARSKPAGRFTRAFYDSAVKTEKSVSNKIPVTMTCIALLVGGVLNYTTAAMPPVSIQNGFSAFPLTIEEWQGRMVTMDSRIIRLSGAEEAFNATYLSPNGEIVALYMGYRSSPFTESENFFHSPNVCLPSLGWKTLEIETHIITEVPGFGEIKVRKMLIEKMGRKQLVYYWFQTKKHISADVNINRFHLTLHALFKDNTHDLFIRPISPLQPTESVIDAEKRLDRFVRILMADLLDFLQKSQSEYPGRVNRN
jgi:exosortase D (VPLPA-CTERM-specific)